ncbi:hypothetical protein BH09MYX1_BH09MYX1_38730 [soil metagenome]
MSFNIVRTGLLALALAASTFAVGCSASAQDAEEAAVEGSDAEIVSRSAHFETFVGMDGKLYFDFVAGNGQNVLRSEGYTSAQGAAKGIAAVTSAGVDASAYDVQLAKNGEYYFNIVAANHEVVATSETYSTKSNATRAATTVRKLILITGATPESTPAIKRERFEVFTGEDKKVYFRLRAGNGEIVLGSQAYTAKSSALNGIDSVKTNGANTARFQIVETVDGEYAIRLVAMNGQIIARGESYVSKSNASRGVDSIVSILKDGVSETAQ